MILGVFVVVLAHAKTNTLTPLSGTTDRPPARLPGRARITGRQRERIVSLYESGLSTRTVAAECDLAKTTVLQVLIKAGISLRPRGGHNQ